MRSINKLRINRLNDMIRLDKNYIFLNLSKREIQRFNSIKLDKEVRIHTFITSNDDIRNGYFDDLVIMFRDNNKHPRSKFIVHIPYNVRTIEAKLRKEYECMNSNPFKVCIERNGLYFRIPNTEYSLNIDYIDNKIVTSIPMEQREIIKKKDPRNVSEDMKKHKEDYKEEYLEFFKATTPLGILKTFKDEDDIWDYIMMQNGWAPTKEEMDRINGVTSNTVKKKVNITTMEKDPQKIKEMMESIMKNAAAELNKELQESGDE